MSKMYYSTPLKAGQGNGICAAAAMQQELGLTREEVAEITHYSPKYLYYTLYDRYSQILEHKLLRYYSEKLLDYQPESPYCHIKLDTNEPYSVDSVQLDFTGGFLAYTNFMRYKHQVSVVELARQAKCSYYTMKDLLEGKLVVQDMEIFQKNIEPYFQVLEERNPKGCDNANRGIARYKLTIL